MPSHDIAAYAAALAAGDYPEAIAIWDAIAGANDAELRLRNGARFNPNLPAIFASFMPKSGGTFLFNRMIRSIGYVDYPWGVTRTNSHSEVYPAPRAVAVYARGGYFCHTHALPTAFFRMMMDPVEVRPFWVHLRHPAEACLAGYFHYQGQGQGEGAVRDERLAGIAAERRFLEENHGFVLEDWDRFFREWSGFYVNWISQWHSYALERPGRVVFTFFDELADPNALLTRLFAALGFRLDIAAAEAALPEDRRRAAGPHDWREGLGPQAQAAAQAAQSLWDRMQAFRP